MIKVFKRRAWKKNPAYADGYEPYSTAPKTHVCYADNEDDARAICREHNQKRVAKDSHFYEWTTT